MGQVSIPWNSFNCGELSPLLEGRSDMPQYMKGGKVMLNMLPTVQGPAERRGGTRYCAPAGVNPTLLIRFSRSATESYVLLFGDHVLKFIFDGGLVEDSPPHVYQIATPYAQADLFNDDGTPKLQAAESADVVYLAHPNYPPQVLSFFAPTNWTIAPLNFVDGPWQDGNPNLALTVFVTGSPLIGSTVAVTSSGGLFDAKMVGSLMRIHQQDLTTIKPWQPGQQTPNIAVGVQRRSGFCTYQVENCSPGTPPSGGTSLLFVQTGGVTLDFTQGKGWDGDQTTTIDPIGGHTYFSTGVQWSYQDCGYGVVLITAFSDAQHVQATVLRQLPVSVMSAGGATNLWELGAWSNDQGWPACVGFFRQRLTFAGGAGAQDRVWMSVTGDYANFADKFFGEVLADSAVTLACQSTQVNNIVCISGADTLFVGTTGSEFLIGPQSISDTFGPLNAQVSELSQFGGRAVTPIRAQQFTLFVDKPGRRLRESTFQFTAGPAGSYVSQDKTVLSEHITQGGIIGMGWAKNPTYAIWMALANGKLISFIYCPEQDVHNWERHDVGNGGEIASIAVIPNVTGEWDDVYINVRYINTYFDVVQYTIERIEQPFANLPGQNQQECFYVDSGLTLANNIDATLIIGGGAQTVGASVGFVSSVFVQSDVGRYIHYDWETTQIGDDGLTYPLATKGIALITEVGVGGCLGTIQAPFPSNPPAVIPADGWRMTVTTILASSIPFQWQGQTLSFLLDGGTAPDQVYSQIGGVDIDLPVPASYIQAGIKSPCQFTSMRPDTGDRTGSAIGKLKRLYRATIRVLNSLGLKLGTVWNDLQTVNMTPPQQPNNVPPPIFTGDTSRETFKGDWDRDGRFTVRQEQPLPLTIVAGGFLGEVSEDS